MSKKVCLDAGHGLRTAGKQTPNGIKEWTINDKVRDKEVEILKEYDVDFVFSDNNEGNVDEKLTVRKSMYLNENVDVAVSNHCNALDGKWGDHTGVEVYVDKNYTEEDMRLAKLIYDKLVKYTGLKGRGIKIADFTIINQNKVPACLVEGGFMDSRIDYPVITSDEGQNAYARAVAEGIIEFLDLKKKTNDTKPEPKPNSNKIAEDGKWGKETTRKAQKVFGTTVDGIVSNQYAMYKKENPGLFDSTFEWKKKPNSCGSELIKAIQRKVGADVNGFMGPETITLMQKWLGTVQDGYVSNPSNMVKAFQKWLNKQ